MLALIITIAVIALAVALGIGLFHSWQKSTQRRLQADRRAYGDWAHPPRLDRDDWQVWERHN